jgi:16S rRNA (uracil1498-N3)-methyltransferase
MFDGSSGSAEAVGTYGSAVDSVSVLTSVESRADLNDSADFSGARMSERFFSEQTIAGPRVTLTGDEARHLATVMRAAPGDEVTLFDGSGAEFAARVVRIGKRDAELEIVARQEISRELPLELTLAVALPKGERQKWLVEKLTELGVTRLVPLVTERGVAEPTPSAIERLRRGVIEASKQCGRNRLMDIGQPARAADFFAAGSQFLGRFVCGPSGVPLVPNRSAALVAAAIGPEGGFTPGELAAARQAGWQVVSLGPRILRVETAAIALAAAVASG